MKAIEFKEVNIRIAENQEEYQTLPVFADTTDPAVPVTMCFELDDEERKQVAETGHVWLTVLTFGQHFHPIAMSCLKPESLSNPDPACMQICESCGEQFDITEMHTDSDSNWFCSECWNVLAPVMRAEYEESIKNEETED